MTKLGSKVQFAGLMLLLTLTSGCFRNRIHCASNVEQRLPVILCEPEDRCAILDEVVSFHVKANAPEAVYHWYQVKTDENGKEVLALQEQAKTNVLEIAAKQQAVYTCFVLSGSEWVRTRNATLALKQKNKDSGASFFSAMTNITSGVITESPIAAAISSAPNGSAPAPAGTGCNFIWKGKATPMSGANWYLVPYTAGGVKYTKCKVWFENTATVTGCRIESYDQKYRRTCQAEGTTVSFTIPADAKKYQFTCYFTGTVPTTSICKVEWTP